MIVLKWRGSGFVDIVMDCNCCFPFGKSAEMLSGPFYSNEGVCKSRNRGFVKPPPYIFMEGEVYF
jgi:hypothetical protein